MKAAEFEGGREQGRRLTKARAERDPRRYDHPRTFRCGRPHRCFTEEPPTIAQPSQEMIYADRQLDADRRIRRISLSAIRDSGAAACICNDRA